MNLSTSVLISLALAMHAEPQLSIEQCLVVPAYFYPAPRPAPGERNPDYPAWNQLKSFLRGSRKSAPGKRHVVIVNPASGPGNRGEKPDENYVKTIRELRDLNAIVIGYIAVGTGDGDARRYLPPHEIMALVDIWKEKYPLIEGFFFDVAPTSVTQLRSMQESVNYARRKFPQAMVVANPGTSPDPSCFDQNVFDVVCVFEDTHEQLQMPGLPDWAKLPPAQKAAIVWDAPDPEASFRSIAALRVKYVYVTDRNLQSGSGLQYGGMPSYLPQLEAIMLNSGQQPK